MQAQFGLFLGAPISCEAMRRRHCRWDSLSIHIRQNQIGLETKDDRKWRIVPHGHSAIHIEDGHFENRGPEHRHIANG